MLRLYRHITAATLIKKLQNVPLSHPMCFFLRSSVFFFSSISADILPLSAVLADWHTGFICTSSNKPARDTRAHPLTARAALSYPARHRSSCFSQLSEFRHTRVKSRLRANTCPPVTSTGTSNHILFIKSWSTVTSPCTKTPITPPPLHLVVWKMEDRLQRVISTKKINTTSE